MNVNWLVYVMIRILILMVAITGVYAFSLPMDYGGNIQIRISDVALSPKGETRLRIDLFNLDGFPHETWKVLDLLTTKGPMRWLQRSTNTNPSIWKTWGNHSDGYVGHYVVDGREERLCKNYGDQPRLAPCETCKTKCKTAIAPSDFI